jgi:hypothetical protein
VVKKTSHPQISFPNFIPINFEKIAEKGTAKLYLHNLSFQTAGILGANHPAIRCSNEQIQDDYPICQGMDKFTTRFIRMRSEESGFHRVDERVDYVLRVANYGALFFKESDIICEECLNKDKRIMYVCYKDFGYLRPELFRGFEQQYFPGICLINCHPVFPMASWLYDPNQPSPWANKIEEFIRKQNTNEQVAHPVYDMKYNPRYVIASEGELIITNKYVRGETLFCLDKQETYKGTSVFTVPRRKTEDVEMLFPIGDMKECHEVLTNTVDVHKVQGLYLHEDNRRYPQFHLIRNRSFEPVSLDILGSTHEVFPHDMEIANRVFGSFAKHLWGAGTPTCFANMPSYIKPEVDDHRLLFPKIENKRVEEIVLCLLKWLSYGVFPHSIVLNIKHGTSPTWYDVCSKLTNTVFPDKGFSDEFDKQYKKGRVIMPEDVYNLRNQAGVKLQQWVKKAKILRSTKFPIQEPYVVFVCKFHAKKIPKNQMTFSKVERMSNTYKKRYCYSTHMYPVNGKLLVHPECLKIRKDFLHKLVKDLPSTTEIIPYYHENNTKPLISFEPPKQLLPENKIKRNYYSEIYNFLSGEENLVNFGSSVNRQYAMIYIIELLEEEQFKEFQITTHQLVNLVTELMLLAKNAMM